MGTAISEGERILERIEAIGGEEKFKAIQAKFLRARRAGPALVQETEDRHLDMIILGVPYRRRFGSCHLGSTASYIFNNASCRVIFLRDQAGIAYFD